MPKKNNKKPPAKAAKKQQSAGKGEIRKTSKAAAQPAPPPKERTHPIFPNKFPFWARLKISKNRTTLVIDEDTVLDKKSKKMVDGFVHREAIHTQKSGDYEEIKPNPDKTDPTPMYLKRPRKLPKSLFKPHNKDLDMPEHLKARYERNNKKSED